MKTPESMSLDVMRRLAIAVHDARVARVELSVCADVAFYLQNRKRVQLADLENESKKQILIRVDPKLGLDELRLELFDMRDSLVVITELGMAPMDLAAPPSGARAQSGRGRRDDRGGRGGRGGGRGGRPPQGRGSEDRYDELASEDEAEESEEEREPDTTPEEEPETQAAGPEDDSAAAPAARKGRGGRAPQEDEEPEEGESQTIDIEESSEIGEGPTEAVGEDNYRDRNYRNRRGGRGRNRGGGGRGGDRGGDRGPDRGGDRQNFSNQQRSNQQRPPVPARPPVAGPDNERRAQYRRTGWRAIGR